jgi:hypothetical protein
MGIINIELFATLDLVGQSPGGPDEDPVGFPFGGWQAPLMDDVTGAQVGAAYEGTDALLLGRRTYDIFAGYWPHQEGEFATLFNSVPKYVASRGKPDLSWAGSTQFGPDLAGAVRDTPATRPAASSDLPSRIASQNRPITSERRPGHPDRASIHNTSKNQVLRSPLELRRLQEHVMRPFGIPSTSHWTGAARDCLILCVSSSG